MGKCICKNRAVICLIFFLLTVFASGVSHALIQEAELFERAYEYYLAFKPEKAVEQFDMFMKQFPNSSALDSVMFWRAKSLLQMKKYEAAEQAFKKLKEIYPESSYAAFAVKELESADKMVHRQERTVRPNDKDRPADPAIRILEDRISRLDDEKADLQMKLSEAEKSRQLIEKGLAKAIKDKDILEAGLGELKRNNEVLSRSLAVAEKNLSQQAGDTEEKKALEARLKDAESRIGDLLADKQKSQLQLAVVTKELTAKVQEGQKDWAKLDLYIKELRLQNEAQAGAIKEKEKLLDDAQGAVTVLEKKISGTETANRAEKESIRRSMLEEITRLKAELSHKTAAEIALQERIARIQQDKTAAEEELKKEKALSAEIAARSAEQKKVMAQERKNAEAQKEALEQQLAELSSRELSARKELADIGQRGREQQKRYLEYEQTAGRLSSEREALEAQVKQKDADIFKANETIASMKDSILIAEKDRQKAVSESQQKLSKVTAERDALQEEIKQEKAKYADISARNFEQAMSKAKEIKALEAEKKGIEDQLSSERKKSSETAAGKSESEAVYQRTVQEFASAKKELEKRLAAAEEELKKINAERAALEAGLSEKDNKLQGLERPFIKIGKRQFSISSFMNEAAASNKIVRKIKAADESWKTGNIFDDFALEQLLAQKAHEQGISGDRLKADSLAKKYAIVNEEREYLNRYLAAEEMYKSILSSALTVSENDIRAYYQQHIDLFVERDREKRVEVVEIRHGKDDEIEKGLIAVDIYQEVSGGMAFETAVKKRQTVSVLKQMSISRLPDWIREKVSDLKSGEISPILSTGSELLIVRIIEDRTVYKPADSVSGEIRTKLMDEKALTQKPELLLKALKQDIELLK